MCISVIRVPFFPTLTSFFISDSLTNLIYICKSHFYSHSGVKMISGDGDFLTHPKSGLTI